MDSCSICLDDKQFPASIDNCIHQFCFQCISDWLKLNGKCPLCKCLVTSVSQSLDNREMKNLMKDKGKEIIRLFRKTKNEARETRYIRTCEVKANKIIVELARIYSMVMQNYRFNDLLLKNLFSNNLNWGGQP